jgi:hypothetical protein
LSDPPVLKGEIVLLIEAAIPEAVVSDEQINQIRKLLESGCKSPRYWIVSARTAVSSEIRFMN